MDQYLGTGRRKTAVARVYLRPGSGSVTINGRSVDEYFHRQENIIVAKQPLVITEKETDFDVLVKVSGGGESGQAGAIRHGVARALVKYDEGLTRTLRANGFLTRDPRMVERKKYGQRGARRKFQFSKR
ncbi:MAG: 30S ribosomal protein S9 [Spirochaetales bacterium]|nr:30S ribosomal protein S9 [Spirochaetales bacterium]